MNPQFPVYVISKGRWESRLTVKALEKRSVPFRLVIEPQEYSQYSAVVDPVKILVLPFNNLGQGSIPARNWVWEHSIQEGAEWHWILDDNLRSFFYYTRNQEYHTRTGVTFRIIEDFVVRYENIGIAGMQYEVFLVKRAKHPPFILNTRVYSCILVRNDLPFRWRGRYNEDTDLSLRVLKSGLCTVLFEVCIVDKGTTMQMKGGNMDDLYQGDGRYQMARSLQIQHPDVAKIRKRWGRWQHVVDYRPFKKNRLRLKPGAVIPEGVNNYDMDFDNAQLRKQESRP